MTAGSGYRVLRAAAFLLVAFTCAARAGGPSFDCSKAATADERAICASDTLAMLDRFVVAGFNAVRQARGNAAAQGVARPTLAARHACGDDEGCIIRAQVAAIEGYGRLGAPLSASVVRDGPPPVTPGQCAASTIAAIGPRLDGLDYDTGTGIAYANGGGGVSYEREDAVIASRPGDPVEMCLLSLPKNCPPGDDRGRWYLTRNGRTGAVWALPDAAHVCGGA
jgi:uncharacterized protein